MAFPNNAFPNNNNLEFTAILELTMSSLTHYPIINNIILCIHNAAHDLVNLSVKLKSKHVN